MTAEQRNRFVKEAVENWPGLSEELNRDYATFSPREQKRIRESIVFARFVRASELATDPLDHENKEPPFPDIFIVTNDGPRYFELVEVTDQALAKSTADAARTGSSECVWFEHEHTIMLRQLREKCAKQYRSDGDPVDLIIYFDWHPPTPLAGAFDERYKAEIRGLILMTSFSRVWIYDNRSMRILLRLERSNWQGDIR